MAHVMIDLETWGTRPGDALRSIGAVVFDPLSGDIAARFYRNILDASSEAAGLVRLQSTVDWWAEQSDAAKAALEKNAVPLSDALHTFTGWFRTNGGEQVYGYGASFDPVLMEAAYRACGMEAPWDFWNTRCCRTILAMANRRPERTSLETHHHALHDAEAQARAVAAAFRAGKFSPN